MTRLAVLADVHGNLPALEAVLADVEAARADLVVSAGDVVSGPMPGECLRALAALGDRVRWVRGNADRLALAPGEGAHPSDLFAAERLGEEDRALLSSFADAFRCDDVLVCHGTPGDDAGVVTWRTPAARLAQVLEGIDARVVVGGHVHHQFMASAGAMSWVNAGSVGMPYEGRPGAFWALVEGDAVVLRRTEYDVEAALARLAATGYPLVDDLAPILRGGVSAQEAAAALEPRTG